jgi:hypothetical protein
LLVVVSKMTGRGIWTHADIIKHSRIGVKNTEIAVILSYCIRGLAKTKVRFTGNRYRYISVIFTTRGTGAVPVSQDSYLHDLSPF